MAADHCVRAPSAETLVRTWGGRSEEERRKRQALTSALRRWNEMMYMSLWEEEGGHPRKAVPVSNSGRWGVVLFPGNWPCADVHSLRNIHTPDTRTYTVSWEIFSSEMWLELVCNGVRRVNCLQVGWYSQLGGGVSSKSSLLPPFQGTHLLAKSVSFQCALNFRVSGDTDLSTKGSSTLKEILS